MGEEQRPENGQELPRCINHIFGTSDEKAIQILGNGNSRRVKIPYIPGGGKGDCRTCVPSPENINCSAYHPVQRWGRAEFVEEGGRLVLKSLNHHNNGNSVAYEREGDRYKVVTSQ